jgi:hypothetical protein
MKLAKTMEQTITVTQLLHTLHLIALRMSVYKTGKYVFPTRRGSVNKAKLPGSPVHRILNTEDRG